MSISTSHHETSGSTPTRASAGGCPPESRVTRSLLGYGIIAGPFYVAVTLTEAAVRDGFDLTRHSWSLLANGPGGWVHVANFLLTGVMVIAAAVGYRRVLLATPGTGRRWAPILLAAYGVGLISAGIFRADPMSGFPLGTPDGPPIEPTMSGTLHLVGAGIGFYGLVGAMFVLARRFHQEGRRGRAWISIATGVGFLASFAGIASGSASTAVILAFTAGVIAAWAWLSATSLHLYRRS